MKRWLAGLLLLAGCSSPATPTAVETPSDLRPASETLFLGALYQYDYPAISAGPVRDEAVQLGWRVCDAHAAGLEDWEIFEAIIRGGSSDKDAIFMIIAAKEHLCPGTSLPG